MAQATSIFPAISPAHPLLPRDPGGLSNTVDSFSPAMPRKLVRPQLPEHLAKPEGAPRRLRGDRPLSLREHTTPARRATPAPASTAEGFFLQKQMQTQTPLVFVLEGNEQVHGVIEWYDRDTIKVRNSTRVLIFKRAIKYLYKANDLHAF